MNTYYLKRFRKKFGIIRMNDGTDNWRLYDLKKQIFIGYKCDHNYCVKQGIINMLQLPSMVEYYKKLKQREIFRDGFKKPIS